MKNFISRRTLSSSACIGPSGISIRKTRQCVPNCAFEKTSEVSTRCCGQPRILSTPCDSSTFAQPKSKGIVPQPASPLSNFLGFWLANHGPLMLKMICGMAGTLMILGVLCPMPAFAVVSEASSSSSNLVSGMSSLNRPIHLWTHRFSREREYHDGMA